MEQRRDTRRGFTLMELLIVVAIIAVLVAIAIPMFTGQLKKARQAADLANMRSAYAAAMVEWMSGSDNGTKQIYYFNGSTATKTSAGIRGYGQSSEDASTFAESLPAPATGVPNDGTSRFCYVVVAADGSATIGWTGALHTARSASEYLALTDEERNAQTTALLDALENQFQTMTVGEVQDLIRQLQAERGGRVLSSNQSYDNVNYREWGRYGSSLCLRVARSSIDTNGNIITSDNPLAGNVIFAPEAFAAAGYDVSSTGGDNYIFTSTSLMRADGSGTRDATPQETEIWIDFGINSDLSAFMRRTDTNTVLSNSVAYINDRGNSQTVYNHNSRVAAHNARMSSQ